jgi:glycerol-1-phosphate dehydrogenase [NAD(P)+]
MQGIRPLVVTIDANAVEQLVRFCLENDLRSLFVVADQNTQRAQGKVVVAALQSAGLHVKALVFTNREVVADGAHILDVLIAAGREDWTYVAVGSGTLTDITRFASHRTKSSFISVPTAPSVDGFTSIGAPLIIHGVKDTVLAQAPIAIFADINTLASAPQPMIAAGFGDMLGKATSVADWRIGRLLWDEPYDDSIALRTLAAVDLCVANAPAIGQGDQSAIRVLMEALIESGFCMLDFGTSRPASGAEHHYSHYWEMKLLQEGRPAILHGAKVGVATSLVASYYDQFRRMSRQEVVDRLEASTLPPRAAEVERIREAYGALADDIVKVQAKFLNLSDADYDQIKHRIVEHWDEIQAIAAQVPPADEIAALLHTAGGPATTSELGLSADEESRAIAYGHYLRDRFTSRKLARVLGLD